MKRELVTQYTDKAQADGPYTIDVSAVQSWEFHQFQIDMHDALTPSAGTLYIAGRTPGATAYQNIGTIDMTGSDLIAVSSGVCFDSIRISSAGFDSTGLYTLTIYSKVR